MIHLIKDFMQGSKSKAHLETEQGLLLLRKRKQGKTNIIVVVGVEVYTEGKGTCAAWLASVEALAVGCAVVVECVHSVRLAGMLERRDYASFSDHYLKVC